MTWHSVKIRFCRLKVHSWFGHGGGNMCLKNKSTISMITTLGGVTNN